MIAQLHLHGVEGTQGVTHFLWTALEQWQTIKIAAEGTCRARQIVERCRRHARGKEGETAHADGQYRQKHGIEARQAKVIRVRCQQDDFDSRPVGEGGRNQPAVQRRVDAPLGSPRKATPRYGEFRADTGAQVSIQRLGEVGVGFLDLLLAAYRAQAGRAPSDQLCSKRGRSAVHQRDEILHTLGETLQLNTSQVRLAPHVRHSQRDGGRSHDPDQQEEEEPPCHGAEVAL